MPCSREPAHTRAPSHECTHSRTHCMRTRTHGCRDAGTHARCQHACARKHTVEREAEGAHHTCLRALPPALARAARLRAQQPWLVLLSRCLWAWLGRRCCTLAAACGVQPARTAHVASCIVRCMLAAARCPLLCHGVRARRRTQTNTRHRRAPALWHLRACHGLRLQCGAAAH